MKTHIIKYILCLCLLCGFASTAKAAEATAPDGTKKMSMSPDEQAIATFMNKDMAAAWQSNKPGKVLGLYSDSEPVMWFDGTNGKTITDKAAKEKELQAFFKKHKVLSFTAGNVVVTKIDDSLGFVTTGQKLLVADLKTGEEVEVNIQAMYEVLKENDGKWRAHREFTFMDDADTMSSAGL